MKYERLTKRGVNILDRRGDGKTIYNRLAILEDMIEDGTLIELPCKVGDKIYRTTRIKGNNFDIVEFIIVEIRIYEEGFDIIDDSDNYFCFDDVNKSVFLNREKAEQHLAEIENFYKHGGKP